MDFDEKKVIELFAGLIFVALLIVIVLLVLYMPGQVKAQGEGISTSNVILNSYNTNYEIKDIPERSYFFGRGEDGYENYDRDYYDYKNKDSYKLKYSSYGEHKREETIFNNYRDEFKVYVVNKDYEGGYFKVKFSFCDYYDNCFSETIERYISAKEEREFFYVDVHEGKYEYWEWEYKIIAPERG